MTNQEIFDMYDKMFALPAWKDLVEDMKQRQSDLAKYLITNPNIDEKALYRAQGINQIYSYIIGLEASTDAAKKHEQEQQELPNV